MIHDFNKPSCNVYMHRKFFLKKCFKRVYICVRI
nr:MAG TPA: hypothetical protein [Caudoviricetes sp.]